jgi:hypothetical protein
MRRTLLLAAVIAIAAPATASAATITREADGTLAYTAAPGAAFNKVNLLGSDDGATLTVSTYGDDDTASWPADCTPSSLYGADVVTCPMPAAVRVDAGDGDDLLQDGTLPVPVTLLGGPGRDTIEGYTSAETLDGGAGDDRLTGYGGDDVLRGGDGNDTVDGGEGRDRLEGGAGDDLLTPDGHEHAGADVVDGGPGYDRIEGDYSSRFEDGEPPVSITFAGGADDGRPGEGDDLRGVEKVYLAVGGRFVGSDAAEEFRLGQVGTPSTMLGAGGDDVLRSGDGPDHLDGGAGNDSVDGGFGDDELIGGPGRDTISGDLAGGDCGPLWCKSPYGNDTIDARDGEVDSVTCGAGTDSVQADPQDVVAPDCETVVRAAAAGPEVGPGPKTGPGPVKRKATLALQGRPRLAAALRSGFVVRVTGAPAARTLTLTARRAGKVVARGSVKVPARGGAVRVRLRFTAAGRRALRRAARASLSVTGATGRTTVVLRR